MTGWRKHEIYTQWNIIKALKKEENIYIFNTTDESGEHYAKWNKTVTGQILHDPTYVRYKNSQTEKQSSILVASSHVWIWVGLQRKLSIRIDAFELWCWRRLESPLDYKEIQPVHPKGNQSWVFIRRTDIEAETPILWPPDAKNWLIGKDPDSGKDWGQEEKGTAEAQMVGWHHQLNGHEFG